MKQNKPYTAIFTFTESLNDFFPPKKQKENTQYLFGGNPSIKDAIEAQGVPHTEVDLITVNDISVGFDYHLKDSDRVGVFPMSENCDITPKIKLQEDHPANLGFICDVHLGKLSRLMRLLGFDTLYRNDYDDPEIVQISVAENRAVLTRDRRLLHAKVITCGCWLHSTNPIEQLSEVIKRFGLEKCTTPFSRCLSCNSVLKPIQKEAIEDSLEPKTRQYYDQFHRCGQCKKVFWKGSHFEALTKIVERFAPGEHSFGMRNGCGE
ncbi:MAG TPA: Mut7-C RNAse domain-containing protein [Chitinispirillaceae bacterium]|nr:Mut7-C RNAse domain-containing protein [Chitinispirillaceae bacterium]